MPKGYSNKTGLPHKPPVSKKGQYHPLLSEEHKRKIALKLKGSKRPNQTLTLRKKKHWQKENNPSWKGGITLKGKKINKQIRKCFKYRQWRSDIFTRDNFICVLCETKGGYLQADHYPKMFSVIINEYKIDSLEKALECEELWNINNGRTLCVPCHKSETFK